MSTLLPDFSQATFKSGQPVDNSYFPLTPGTVLSYQGSKYETEEIIEEVAEEIAEEITEAIVEELAEELTEEITEEIAEKLAEKLTEGGDIEEEFDNELEVDNVDEEVDGEDEELDQLAEEIADELEDDIDELVDEVIEEEEIDEKIEQLADEILDDIDDDLDELIDELAEELGNDIDEATIAEIIQEVAEELGSEIAEEITAELTGEDVDEIEDDEVKDNKIDEIVDEIEDDIDELAEDIAEEIVESVNEIAGEELTEAITDELIEDITEELTGEEVDEPDHNHNLNDFAEEIVEELDDGIDELAEEAAEEIVEAQGDFFATESNQVIVTHDTKNILGVETTVVRDVAWDEGVLVEDTLDWYAQDTVGNVWYLGELATNYEYNDEGNFIGTNTEGSWEAGVDGALAGYLMEANPQVGDSYFQEFAPSIAEDEGEVISIDESISIDLGDFENVLKTRDFTQLQPDVFEFKYYAPGVGQILAEEGITEEEGEPELSPELIGVSEIPNVTLPALSTTTFEDSTVIDNPYFTLIPETLSLYEEDFDLNDDGIERHEVFVTDQTRDVLGITSRVVSDREFDNDLLTDDKLSYYAQDSSGNVWLLGETITEYEYDETGNLIDTDESESWLAGEGQSLPGLIMAASPETGDAYYQRFDIGEAENQAEIVESDLSLTVDGDNFEDVIKIKEFSVLEPDEFDFKYYAPNIGLVFEEEIKEDELVFTSELDDSYEVSDSHIVDFDTTSSGDELLAGTSITTQYDSFSGLTISTPRDKFGAMIFDTNNPTGGDFDLATENQGNVLIISEDGDASDPDDKAGGGTIRFQWSDEVLVNSISLLDIEETGGSISVYGDDGDLLRTIAIPDFGDNSLGQLDINTADVAYLDVDLVGSGAITELSFNSLSEA